MRVRDAANVSRRAILVRGIVQGVGFRPFVFTLARRFELGGFVRNRVGDVLIEVEGAPSAIERFTAALAAEAPPLARLDEVASDAVAPRDDGAFRVDASDVASDGVAALAPDVATCDACVSELFDRHNRRWRYPFITCALCGPRLTIATAAPWDRARTTMRVFPMCSQCRAEYEDPRDRRFHAESIACASCGPRLSASDAGGRALDGDDAVAAFATAIARGAIGALKGIGGYHLVCDARSETAVRELRRRKQRDDKPFALLAADIETARAWCAIDEDERALLESPARPIVLLRRVTDAPIAAAVAPGLHELGVLLPYAPVHHLLARALDGAPLVLTSGNVSDEPIAYRDDDARARLGGIAAVFLTHDRPIETRVDDSVVRRGTPLRRARGQAPLPLALVSPLAVPTLATGAQQKATFALGVGARAVVSHHLGDLGFYEAYRAWNEAIDAYERLFRITPRRIVHDLHPDYASTRWACERAARDRSLTLVAAQHHHAHLASCMTEHQLDGPAIGVCFDGGGFGSDGAIWGGEVLVGDARRFVRAAHLGYVPLPGGAQAIREPWRMAAAHLLHAGQSLGQLQSRVEPAALRAVEQLVARGFNSPRTSSVGRLFDAVAALVGVCERASYEGQAAMRLEALAADATPEPGYALPLVGDETVALGGGAPLILDPRPLLSELVGDLAVGVDARRVARRFHAALADAVTHTCERLRAAGGPADVVLSGGVFANAILVDACRAQLRAAGLRVHRHEVVPPGDGGLSLGQLAIAAAADVA